MTNRSRLVLFLAVLFCAANVKPEVSARSSEKRPDRVPGEIIIRFKSESDARMAPASESLKALHKAKGLRQVRRLVNKQPAGRVNADEAQRRARRAARAPKVLRDRLPELEAKLERTAVLSFDPSANVEDLIKFYRSDPSVEAVEPNFIYHTALVPNDPSYGALYGMTKIQAPAAWDLKNGSGTVVAVSDTGVDYNHQDLAANIWNNSDEIAGNGADDDGNGFVDDVRGWDFAYGDNNPMDVHSHGTHVAGTIAAVGNNNAGVIGVAYGAKIMPVKGLDDGGYGDTTELIGTIYYAANNGADVINASWGGGGFSQAMADAIAYAQSQGVIFVAAAGNNNGDASFFYPAAYPGAIAVAATDSGDQKASFSNWGSRIDVAAPGVSIYSAIPGNTYQYMSGTSMASPHVAGLAALIVAQRPGYNVFQISQALRQSTDDLGTPGFDIYFGNGRINALKALQLPTMPPSDTTAPLVAITQPAAGATVSGQVTVTGTASDNISLQRVEILVDGVVKGNADGLAGWSYVWNTNLLTEGAHTLTAKAYDAAGLNASASRSVTVHNAILSGNAAYSAQYSAPACALPGAACDTGSVLIRGRGAMISGAETNAPNAVNNSCSDGSAGSFHVDESLDQLKVFAVDGSTMTAGKSARIEAKVWAYASSGDFLDFFYSTNAANPSWNYITTVLATAGGAQTLTATYTLPNAPIQAVRANFRYSGAPGACTVGPYDDRDDLVFAVQASTADLTPPVVSISSPAAGSVLAGVFALRANAVDNVAVAGVQFKSNNQDLGPVLTTAPYVYGWNTLTALEGPVSLGATATDKAGNASAAAEIFVWVNNYPTLAHNLRASPVTLSTATLTWNTDHRSAVHEIEYGTTTVYGTVISYSSPFVSTQTYPVRNLMPGTTYYARVRSRQGSFEPWGVSNGISFVTQALTPPSAPTFISMIDEGPRTIQVQWGQAAGTVQGYRLDLSTSAIFSPAWPFYQNRDVGLTNTVYISSLTPNTTYYARVRAYNSAGVSGNSPVGQWKTPGLPDVVVVFSTANPVAVQPGAKVWIVAAYQNQGQGPTGAWTSWQMFGDAETTPRFNLSVPSYSPGGQLAQEFLWTAPLAAGVHSIKGVADATGLVEELNEPNNNALSYYTVDGTTPTTAIGGLVAGSTVSGVVPLTLSASDNHQLKLVTFYVDGSTEIARSTAAAVSFSKAFSWDTRLYPNGPHYIVGQAHDRAGNYSAPAAVLVNVLNSSTSDNAQRVTGSTAPVTLVQRQRITLNVSMKNTGTTTWTRAAGYQLGSINPTDNAHWGFNRVALGTGDIIVPGGTKGFNLTVTAPSTPAAYNLGWKMMKSSTIAPNLYFGQAAYDQMVTVIADTAAPTIPPTAGLTIPSTGTLTFSWGTSTDQAGMSGYRIDVSTNASFSPLLQAYNNLNVGNVKSRLLTGLTPGKIHYARVRAVDVNGLISGNRGAAPLATLLTPDMTGPAVAITAPAPGQLLTANVTVTATASDAVGVKHVRFYLDGVLKVTDTAAPYSWVWSVYSTTDGPHSLSAVAYDHANNASTSTINVATAYDRTAPNAPPNARFSLPSTNALMVQWDAASDNVGVTGYRLDLSSSPAFATFIYNNFNIGNALSRQITGLSLGTTYYARVRAYDLNGNTSTNSAAAVGKTLSASDTVNPVVTISSPAAGAVVTGTVTISATASDANGITQVRFYVDNVLKFTDTAAPYAYAWNTTLVSTGTHTVKVYAYDPSGRVGSQTRTVTVTRSGTSGFAAPALGAPTAGFTLTEAFVYPNPVRNGRGTVQVQTGTADSVSLKLYALTGEKIWETRLEGTPAIAANGKLAYETPLDAANLASGSYLLQVEAVKDGEKQRKTAKIAVVR